MPFFQKKLRKKKYKFNLHVVCYASLRLRILVQGYELHVVCPLSWATHLLYMLFAVRRFACVPLRRVVSYMLFLGAVNHKFALHVVCCPPSRLCAFA